MTPSIGGKVGPTGRRSFRFGLSLLVLFSAYVFGPISTSNGRSSSVVISDVTTPAAFSSQNSASAARLKSRLFFGNAIPTFPIPVFPTLTKAGIISDNSASYRPSTAGSLSRVQLASSLKQVTSCPAKSIISSSKLDRLTPNDIRPHFLISVEMREDCSGVKDRGARNLINSNSALSARSLACAAAERAAANLSFERRRNSVWMLLSHMPRATSPTMPNAIAALVMADSLRNVLYGGSSQSITNSVATATTTATPHQMTQRSHDADASSSWLSAALLIVPRGKYHAGKNRLRTVLVALVVCSLLMAALLIMAW